jgi:hypothetical protein
MDQGEQEMEEMGCVLCDFSREPARGECAICYLPLDDEKTHKLECGHEFHTDCAITWFRSGPGNNTCPLCRATPNVRMRAVDVLHRARMLIARHRNGQRAVTNDEVGFVERVQYIDDIDARMDQTQRAQKHYIERFHATDAVKKKQILKEYRELRDEFRKRTTPMLKELDRIDDRDGRQRRRYKREMAELKRKRRIAMREVGLWGER